MRSGAGQLRTDAAMRDACIEHQGETDSAGVAVVPSARARRDDCIEHQGHSAGAGAAGLLMTPVTTGLKAGSHRRH